MFKNLLKAGTTFTLLLGCYLGYVQGFGLVVKRLEAFRPTSDVFFEPRDSRSKQEAIAQARLGLGDDHWAVTNPQRYSYYNSERGMWMFTLQYEEVPGYDGKRLKMEPFAVVWRSSDGKNIQTLTADSAILDMNQKVGLSSKQSSEGMKVKHAHIERDVRIRDDKGTPDRPSDDMNIGPMTYLDFDDDTQKITTESHVVARDLDQTVVGDGLEIQLRKPDPAMGASGSSGFAGLDYAILSKNVRVDMRDVGSSGVLPGGGAKTARGAAKKGAASKGTPAVGSGNLAAGPAAKEAGTKGSTSQPADEPVPMHIQSESLMRVDWPPDRVPVLEGPPAPPLPTLVRFERNVVALHGRVDRDPNQLDCDTLRLWLIPGAPAPAPDRGDRQDAGDQAGATATANGPAPAAQSATTTAAVPRAAATPTDGAAAESRAGAKPPEGEAGGKPSKGLFGNLTLQKVHATGHAVWLQLREQGTKVRSNELTHVRRAPYWPDYTFFRGDQTRPIWMEKVDYEPEEEGDEAVDAKGGRPGQVAAAPKKPRVISSVTHIRTITATLFDRGFGLELADILAYGPGRLDTRPDPKEPVERIVEWQDELRIVNTVAPDGTLQKKWVTLTGTRPFFKDVVRKTSLDSGLEIQVFLKPRTPQSAPAPDAATPGGAGGDLAAHVAARPAGGTLDAIAAPAPPGEQHAGANGDAASKPSASAEAGLGGSLQIERLLAYRDVHFVAPDRKMHAREWLDAPFIEVDPPPPAEPATAAESEAETAVAGDANADANANAEGTPSPGAERPAQEPSRATATPVVAAGAGDAQPPPQEPAMTGVADRIWAKVAQPRGKGIDDGKRKRRPKKAEKTGSSTAEMASADPTAIGAGEPEKKDSGTGEGQAEVREAWLRGRVALHQDVAPDPEKKDQAKPKGNDITGEAVYLDNQGKGKVNARVYQLDSTRQAPLPGPMPLAMVSTDDMIIRGGIIYMDQEHDKVWVHGAGSLKQWTDRGLLTDKAPGPQPDAEPRPGDSDLAVQKTAVVFLDEPGAPRAGDRGGDRRTGGVEGYSPGRASGPAPGGAPRIAAAADDEALDGPPEPSEPVKVKTRAGRPVGDKDVITITWTERMEFDGRTRDPMGRPAGRADFYGVVNAEMTDAMLFCERKMIAFTDREVPLDRFGSQDKGPGPGDADEPDPDDESAYAERGKGPGPRRVKANLALIYCYGNPVAISRKVDPDAPVVLEKERIDAWDIEKTARDGRATLIPGRLDYNRLNGEFFVPGPGIVYLYNRPDDSEKKKDGKEKKPGQSGSDGGSSRTADGRTVAPTSGRAPNAGAGAGGSTTADVDLAAARGRQPAASLETAQDPWALLPSPTVTRRIPPLVLTQIEFRTGMKGRFGTGQDEDTRQDRWSEFYGNIELVRSPIDSDGYVLDPDRLLPENGFYMTSQILRVIQEPPPAGSPASTPARTFIRAWDQVHINKGDDVAVRADVATYDSASDQIYAYGEGGHGVAMVQQLGPGQPASVSYDKAIQYNIKTHEGRKIGSETVTFFDKKTGGRPQRIPIPDPTAKPKKPFKKPFFVPNTNLERRGFTGY